MKKDIHPTYYPRASVSCACGNRFFIGSAREFIETEVCYKCHPFYTKRENILDTLGRVQKFKERMAKKSDKPKKQKNKKAKARKSKTL